MRQLANFHSTGHLRQLVRQSIGHWISRCIYIALNYKVLIKIVRFMVRDECSCSTQ